MMLRYIFTYFFLLSVFSYSQAKNLQGDTTSSKAPFKFTFSKSKAAKELPDSVRKTIVSKSKASAAMPTPVSRANNMAILKRKKKFQTVWQQWKK